MSLASFLTTGSEILDWLRVPALILITVILPCGIWLRVKDTRPGIYQPFFGSAQITKQWNPRKYWLYWSLEYLAYVWFVFVLAYNWYKIFFGKLS